MKKIRFNVWNLALNSDRPKPIDYDSPHCASGQCGWCAGRRRQARQAATQVLEASTRPGMFWESKIGGHQEKLGPSAPNSWLATFVKKS